jgi:hypothetical protein
MDFMKNEPDLFSESCPAACDESKVMNMKVEELLDVQGQEDHVPEGVVSVNIEQQVSCMCL